ncbi:hypothetical protein CC78DRAFT_561920 [Lojkania enalia]|uniref:Uncharacterized protein n=1 Tax=Lojkania enalia TaxID=147567 RepID=A0A9P4K179_9PLEO|nr:hypothetical protein CC78DRAFT_561920 [Didymosphaeria enalia]
MEEKNIQQQKFIYICDFAPSGTHYKDKIDIDVLQSAEFDSSEARRRPSDTQFRWIHISVNDINVVEAQSLPDTWLQKLRPTSSIPKDIIHATELQNEGDSIAQPAFTLFLPFLNWEAFRNIRDQKLGTSHKLTTACHPRRTLDQFFYSGLRNTKYRDAGQTVSKWTGAHPGVNGRTKAADDSYVVMVGQLWVWVLEDAILISCFPSHDFQFLGDPDGTQYIDVMNSTMLDIGKCQDLFDLTALLVMHSVTKIFAEENGKFADLIAIYRWAIANKAARQTENFEAFSRRQASRNSDEIAAEGIDELNLTLEVADILDELNMLLLLLEKQADVLASMRGKLYRFKPMAPSKERGRHTTVIKQSNLGQIHVSNSGNIRSTLALEDVNASDLRVFNEEGILSGFRAIGGNTGILLQEAEQTLKVEKGNLNRLRTDATRTHEMLIGLLDLEQKTASLTEARATTKQGKAVMLFTIVTIIFLPLSFFTSYFGQNVSDITRDDNNPKAIELWRIAGPISVVVILFALLVAYFIMFPCKKARKEFERIIHHQKHCNAGPH